MEKSMNIDTVKVETDVSIHNEEDVIGMETDAVCVPQECEPEEKIDTVTVEGVESVGEEDCIKIKTEEDYIQLVRTVKSEQESCTDPLHIPPGSSSDTYGTASDCAYHVGNVKVEEKLDIQEEEWEVKVKTEGHIEESCTDPLHIPPGSSSDTYGTASDCAYRVGNVKVEEKLDMQEEEGEMNVKTERDIKGENCMCCVEGETVSCSETCVTCDGDGTEEVSITFEDTLHIKEESIIKVEEAIDIKVEIPEAKTFPPIKTEHEVHMRSHRGERPYTCDACSRSFTAKSVLVTHYRTHSGERPYQCPECGKAFTTSSYLLVHRRSHSDEKPFQCELCKKCFKTRQLLKKHQVSHTDRKFECQECKKTFKQKKSYKLHSKIGCRVDKEFRCSYCGKRSADRSGLTRHLRLHTGEKPYGCDVCGARYSDSSALKSHKRNHTAEKPYHCVDCDLYFKSPNNLSRHRKNVHTKKLP